MSTAAIANRHFPDSFYSDEDMLPLKFCSKEEEDNFYIPLKDYDILKILPTPPLSPDHEPDFSQCHFDLIPHDVNPKINYYDESHPHIVPTVSLTSHEDPMWSSHVLDSEIQRITAKNNFSTQRLSQSTPRLTPSMDINGQEAICVDPKSVFAAYNWSFPTYHTTTTTNFSNMATDTPSDSEEEIDVVSTTKKSPYHRRSADSVQMSNVLCDVHVTHNYSKPHSHRPQVIQTSSKDFVKQRTSNSIWPTSEFSLLKKNLKHRVAVKCKNSLKRTKYLNAKESSSGNLAIMSVDTVDSRTCLTRSRKLNRSSYQVDSVHETPAKRNQHNVLERKRRNDLKSNFYGLRDAVPDLCSLQRAPKVLILQKALSYIAELEAQQSSLSMELEQQSIKNRQLLKKYKNLEDLLELN